MPRVRLRCLQLTGTNEIIGEEASCHIAVTIPLSGDWEQYATVVGFDLSVGEDGYLTVADTDARQTTQISTHETPSGMRTELAVTALESRYKACGYILHDGILYNISVTDEAADTAQRLIKQVADSLA